MDKMRQFMHHHILDAFLRCMEKTLIECDDPRARLAASPPGAHAAQTQRRGGDEIAFPKDRHPPVDERREKLAMLIQRFRAGVNTTDLTLAHSDSAIQPLIVGDNHKALQLAQTLRQQGYWVTAIRPPTVPVGTARLRITLTQAHEVQDIDNLLEVLHGAGQ